MRAVLSFLLAVAVASLLVWLTGCTAVRQVTYEEAMIRGPVPVRVLLRDGRLLRLDRIAVSPDVLSGEGSVTVDGREFPFLGSTRRDDIVRIDTEDRSLRTVTLIGASVGAGVLLWVLTRPDDQSPIFIR